MMYHRELVALLKEKSTEDVYMHSEVLQNMGIDADAVAAEAGRKVRDVHSVKESENSGLEFDTGFIVFMPEER